MKMHLSCIKKMFSIPYMLSEYRFLYWRWCSILDLKIEYLYFIRARNVQFLYNCFSSNEVKTPDFLWWREDKTETVDILLCHHSIVLVHGVAKNRQQQIAIVRGIGVSSRLVHSHQRGTLISIVIAWSVCTRSDTAQIHIKERWNYEKLLMQPAAGIERRIKWRSLRRGWLSRSCSRGADRHWSWQWRFVRESSKLCDWTYHWSGRWGFVRESSKLCDWTLIHSAASCKIKETNILYRSWSIC